MTIRMLVDALHEEETRVVIADDSHVIDFDIESSTKRQVKGNIYLAKVTRVEPSLQAAFVEYGAGRQGFLPFSEIHPDYYQIPVADKQALIQAQAEERAAAQRDADAELDRQEAALNARNNAQQGDENPAEDSFEQAPYEQAPEEITTIAESHEVSAELVIENAEAIEGQPAPQENAEIIEVNEEKVMEDLGGDDPLEEQPRRSSVRRYKIQEVIKKNQVMLIQVIKEERGNKGASVTTYISLPGRYCVLMPNTSHGGGVSRKISDAKERRKLKELLEGLELNDGMSLIIRTAGMGHSKADIARDYSYLIRLWNKIRELTLSSSAPALVYEEGNVIKRSIRDFFNSNVDELVIAGQDALETGREFVRMLLPAQIDKVIEHNDIMPVFQKYGVERHLNSMNDSTVVMRSGGYIVINSTEALISIDVNSGRATGERNVEDTATRTNIEAAQEIARQLRLRDLAGLIVIDFIDMMDSRHRRGVERALKDALKADRAKIQVGRISPFGLLEMSRQRLRPSLNEIQMIECPTCKGVGHIRSHDSAMLYLMRAIENEIAVADYDNFDTAKVHVTTSADLALHLLNNKRQRITELENQYNFRLFVQVGHMPIGQFTIQLEDANGNRGRVMSSEDKDSRLPQSRGEGAGKGGRRRDRNRNRNRNDRDNRGENRPAPVSTADMPVDDYMNDPADIEADDNFAVDGENNRDDNNRERGGRNRNRNRNRRNRDRNRNNQNQQGDSANAEGQTEGQVEGAEGENLEQDNNHQPQNQNGTSRRGDRYEGRRGRRGRRGGRNNFNRNENGAEGTAEGNTEYPQEENAEHSYENNERIEGEAVKQYQSRSEAPKADVVELERKAPQAEDYPAADSADAEDENKPRKGGWWRKK